MDCQLPFLPSSTKLTSYFQVFGSIVSILGIIAIAVGVGVSVSNKNKHNNNASTKSNSDSTAGDPVQSDPNDPSTFEKNSAFHKAFYGLAYTPEGSQLPNCGNKLENVIKDIQVRRAGPFSPSIVPGRALGNRDELMNTCMKRRSCRS